MSHDDEKVRIFEIPMYHASRTHTEGGEGYSVTVVIGFGRLTEGRCYCRIMVIMVRRRNVAIPNFLHQFTSFHQVFIK